MSDDDRLRWYADALATAITVAVGPWIEVCVANAAEAWRPGSAVGLASAATEAAGRATAEVGLAVRVLLATDVDQQRANPLALLRSAVRYPTAVLATAGVPPVERDEFACRAFPDDLYDLTPASFADVHPTLHEPGLMWGAAKAHVILSRRRAEGRRC